MVTQFTHPSGSLEKCLFFLPAFLYPLKIRGVSHVCENPLQVSKFPCWQNCEWTRQGESSVLMWPRLLLLVAAGAALELSSTTARTPATNTPSPSSRPTTGFASSSTSFSSSSSSSTSTKGPTPPPPAQEECVDLVDFCDQLKPVCIGTIIVDQLTQLASIADEIDKR